MEALQRCDGLPRRAAEGGPWHRWLGLHLCKTALISAPLLSLAALDLQLAAGRKAYGNGESVRERGARVGNGNAPGWRHGRAARGSSCPAGRRSSAWRPGATRHPPEVAGCGYSRLRAAPTPPLAKVGGLDANQAGFGAPKQICMVGRPEADLQIHELASAAPARPPRAAASLSSTGPAQASWSNTVSARLAQPHM